MIYSAAVITVSDKGSRGERVDTSGPAVSDILREKGWFISYANIIPDDKEQIKSELIKCTDEFNISLIITTGGTGFSPRDFTPEATLEVIERKTPGIPEAMRAESFKITPKGCLSRSEAGIRGRSLIVNLPGSEKAARENLTAVIDPIRHGVEMLLGSGSADCGEAAPGKAKEAPSLDKWMREAKLDINSEKIGMYLSHRGVVRTTAKAMVREGKENTSPVIGMRFSCDKEKIDLLISKTRQMDGIYYVRVWMNEGELNAGDDIMQVLIGGDIRPHVVDALQFLVSEIKAACVKEEEIFALKETGSRSV